MIKPPSVPGTNFMKMPIQFVPSDILVRLWDEWDGGAPFYCGDYWFEDVLFELQRRGEGHRCAL